MQRSIVNVYNIPATHSDQSAASEDLKLMAAGHAHLLNTPRYALSRPSNLYKLQLQAQVRVQIQQIDGAIQLLKKEHGSIMTLIQMTGLSSACTAMTQPNNAKASEVVNQACFAAQFELPRAESGIEAFGAFQSSETAVGNKRSILELVSIPKIKVQHTPQEFNAQELSSGMKRARVQ